MRYTWLVGLVALAAACGGSSKSEAPAPQAPLQKTGSLLNRRAFSGPFSVGGASGTCTVVVPPAASAGPATAVCATSPTSTTTLTGGYAPFMGSSAEGRQLTQAAAAGGGTVTLTYAGPPAWSLVLTLGGGTSSYGVGEAEGTLTIGGVTGGVVLTDATVDPMTAYCGSFTGSDTGLWLVGVNSTTALGGAVNSSNAFLVLRGTRTGNSVGLTIYYLGQAGGTATGTISGAGTSLSGSWTVPQPPPSPPDTGTWTGSVCAGSDNVAPNCCGTGAASNCCFGKSCTCLPGG
jgi:hypothetical protein